MDSYLLAALYSCLTGILTLYYHIIISIKIEKIYKKCGFWDSPTTNKLKNIIIFFYNIII